ncbi:MAG: hypothetical protein JSU04_20195 [Bdellovibrionales bacterium]|nr:hypothetical protein [Bdellovibrionales bacterium]
MDRRFNWINDLYRGHLKVSEEKGQVRAKPLLGDKDIERFLSKYLTSLAASSKSEVDPSKFLTKASQLKIEKVMSREDLIDVLTTSNSHTENYFIFKTVVLDFIRNSLSIKNFEKLLKAILKLHLYSEFLEIAENKIRIAPSKEWLNLLCKGPRKRKDYFETRFSRGEFNEKEIDSEIYYTGPGQISSFSREFGHSPIKANYSLKFRLMARMFPKEFVTWFEAIKNVPFQLAVFESLDVDKDRDLAMALIKFVDFGVNQRQLSKSVLAPLLVESGVSYYKDLVSTLQMTSRNASFDEKTKHWIQRAETEIKNIENDERPKFFEEFLGVVLNARGGILVSIDLAMELARSVYHLEVRDDGESSPSLAIYTALIAELSHRGITSEFILKRFKEIDRFLISLDHYTKGYAFFVAIELAKTQADFELLFQWLRELMCAKQSLITSMANEFSKVRVASYQKVATVIYNSKVSLDELKALWKDLYPQRGSLIFGRSGHDDLAASKFLISLEFAMIDIFGDHKTNIEIEDLWKLAQEHQVLLYDNYNVLVRIDDHIYLKSFAYIPAIFKEEWSSVVSEQWYNFSHKKRFVLLAAANLIANGISFSEVDDFFSKKGISLRESWNAANLENAWRTNSQKAVMGWIDAHVVSHLDLEGN